MSCCNQLLQVVEQINRRAGRSFVAREMEWTNSSLKKKDAGAQNTTCKAQEMFNESTLYNMASQFAMDVIRFGYF